MGGTRHMLDDKAQPLRLTNIYRLKMGNPSGAHVAGVDRFAKGNLGKQHQLLRRIDAIEIERRIGLAKATTTRLRERIAKRHPGLTHLRKNEIGGTVDD